VYISGIWGAKSPGRIESNFLEEYIPDVNTCFKFGDDRLRGFSVGWGSNFATSHWLWRSSLQHSHTTVWACDAKSLRVLCAKTFVTILPPERGNVTASCLSVRLSVRNVEVSWSQLETFKDNFTVS